MTTDRTDALTALWLGALTVGTWPLLVAAAGPGTPLVGLVAHVSGMLAGYGVEAGLPSAQLHEERFAF